MSGLEIIFGIALPLSMIYALNRERKRRREIIRMEKILDNNGIHYQPSTMYRAKKGWKNMFKFGKKRNHCKVDEVQIVGEENIVNWEEYNR